MGDRTHTLRRQEHAKSCVCCLAAKVRKPLIASYTLTRSSDGKTWAVCINHAAQAAHRFGIEHSVFNPSGKVTTKWE